MTAVIVRLDLVEPHRLRYAWNPVQDSRVIPKLGEIGQAAAITFEVTVIDDVKANERCEQTPVRFGDAVNYQERPGRKSALKRYASGDGPWSGRFGRIADCAQAA